MDLSRAIGVLSAACLLIAAAPDPAALLASVDASRGRIDAGLEFTVDVDCDGLEGARLKRSYKVRSFGPKAVAAAVQPPERVGELLVVNGRFLHQIPARSRRPVAVTLAERVGGFASIGDILATGYGEIYTGKVSGSEQLDGKATHLVALTAKDRTATYPAMKLWVDAKTQVALKAEMMNEAGKVLKRVSYAYDHEIALKGDTRRPFLSTAKLVHLDTDTASACDVRFGAPSAVQTADDEFDLKKIVAAKP